jgi:hypothetical protein
LPLVSASSQAIAAAVRGSLLPLEGILDDAESILREEEEGRSDCTRRWQGGEGRGDIPDVDTNADGGRRRMMMIDLELATQILMQGGYDRWNVVDEMQEYFAMFDSSNKGYVTLEDL